MSEIRASPSSRLRILVAEDDRAIAGLVEAILLDLGYTVVGPVGTVPEALRTIRTDDIDGALLDVQLGEANVSSAVSELVLRSTPFILMSGHGSRGLPAGFVGKAPLLSKPFKVQQLEDMIDSTFRVCDRNRPVEP